MTEAIAAVVREPNGPMTMEKVQLAEPQGRELIVRMVGSGICHTDFTLMQVGILIPGIYGHEGSGVVEKVGPMVSKVRPGDHVVISVPSCGTCPACIQGRTSYCANINEVLFTTRKDGTPTITIGDEAIRHMYGSSFSTHMITSERNVAKVTKDVPLEILGPLGCGIQTGAGAVMNSLKVNAGSSIAIFGMGTVGLSAVMAAKICGCSKIIVIDINIERLQTAKEFGATDTVNPEDGDVVKAIYDITEGMGADYSLECVGIPAVFRQAVECINTSGICGLIGFPPPGVEVSLDMNSILWGRTIRGIIEGDSNIDLFIPKLVKMYKMGMLPFDRLIKFYKFDEISKACDDMKKGKVIKPILRF